VAWDRTPLGLETAPTFGRALRWLEEEAGKRWNLLKREVSGAARVAEHDTTGSINRQLLLHTWNARSVQGMASDGK
jgi:hypothetical protein